MCTSLNLLGGQDEADLLPELRNRSIMLRHDRVTTKGRLDSSAVLAKELVLGLLLDRPDIRARRAPDMALASTGRRASVEATTSSRAAARAGGRERRGSEVSVAVDGVEDGAAGSDARVVEGVLGLEEEVERGRREADIVLVVVVVGGEVVRVKVGRRGPGAAAKTLEAGWAEAADYLLGVGRVLDAGVKVHHIVVVVLEIEVHVVVVVGRRGQEVGQGVLVDVLGQRRLALGRDVAREDDAGRRPGVPAGRRVEAKRHDDDAFFGVLFSWNLAVQRTKPRSGTVLWTLMLAS